MDMIQLLCGVFGAVVLFLLIYRKPRGGPRDAKSEEFLTKHNYSGVSHDIEFFFYFPVEENAQRAAKKLEKRGYKLIAPIAINPINNQWSVVVMINVEIAEDVLVGCDHALFDIAKSEGGEYDGWGAVDIQGEAA